MLNCGKIKPWQISQRLPHFWTFYVVFLVGSMALPPLNRYRKVSNTVFKATALTLSTAAVIGNLYIFANLLSIVSYRSSKKELTEASSTQEN
jgi:heme/copper-type cytochrome/quinol oxidase subunit 2